MSNRDRFHELLTSDRPVMFDGGMGTMLYARGVFINRSYDEINLKDPELVGQIHRAYVNAGAEIIETNSFGANPVKLHEHSLSDETFQINAQAALIAKHAAGERALVAGSVGPLGIRLEPYGPTSHEEARAFFRTQVEGLLDGGVDLFVLETFSDLEEIHQAIRAVQEASDLPIVAQMTIREDGTTAYGSAPELCASRLDEWGADVVGLNCSVGPAGILDALVHLARGTTKKLSAQPNAGLPREVHGRKMYMASPEYMAKYAERLIKAGAKFVGGCCGTTPEHIRRMADAVAALSPGRTRTKIRVEAVRSEEAEREPVPLTERSRLGRKLDAGELVTSVEIVPPKGVDPASMLAGVRMLKEAGVDAVNVPDGPRAQMRMGVLATSALVEQMVGIEAVVHYTCRDRNLLGMLSDLLGAHALGLRNLLLITGDPPKMGPYPDATAVFDIDSIGLTNLVNRLNHGLDPGGNPTGEPTSFTIGVGLNPGAVDLDHELHRFYWKAEAGAEYAITQPVFDSDQLLAVIEALKERDIWVPIIAGIWPLVSLRNAEFLANEVPGINVPDPILARMRKANDRGKEHALEEGILIAREIFQRVRSDVQGIQVSAPFGKVPFALQVFADVDGVDGAVVEVALDEADRVGFRPPGKVS